MPIKKYTSFIAVFLCFFLLFTFLASPQAAFAAEKETQAALKKAVAYLAKLQNSDGGFPSDAGRSSNKTTTAWALMALSAAGENIQAGHWVKNGVSPVKYLQTGSVPLPATTDYARMLLGLQAGGAGSMYQGEDLAQKLLSFQQTNGQFAQVDKGEQQMINAHMWAILALASAGQEIPQREKALKWLKDRQNADGGYGWGEGLESDPDDTGIALTVLALLGEKKESNSAIAKALGYLQKLQVDGGFAWTGQSASTAADAWVIQGLAAVDADTSKTVAHLLGFQNQDGSFNWTGELKSSPVLMTSYAVIALCQKPFPVNKDFKSIVAGAAAPALQISLTVGKKEAYVNGQKKTLDVPPALLHNRTMVPLRFAGEYLGANLDWHAETSRIDITYQGQTFSLTIGQTLPGLDVPAMLVDGRTLVPLRYLSEKMGATVNWVAAEGRIEIER
ncbi:MAG: stalk domain-containing protein [Clostridia bacterium]|jgi:hypothetical protein|nr:stalk domain-containing protein [Clostridia bacterium]